MRTKPTDMIRGKVVVALVGALLIVGSGTAVALAATHGDLGKLGSELVAGQSSNEQQGQQSEPTKGPNSEPTHSSGPAIASGATDIQGRVGNVNAIKGSFTLSTNDGWMTVMVNGSTQFKGSLSGLAGLQSNMNVKVLGTKQSDGSILAAVIEAGNVSGTGTEPTPGTEPTHTSDPTPEPTHAPEATPTPGASG